MCCSPAACAASTCTPRTARHSVSSRLWYTDDAGASPSPSSSATRQSRAVSASELTADDLVQRLASLRQHERAGVRSPHKPLLVLLALAGSRLRVEQHAAVGGRGEADRPDRRVRSRLTHRAGTERRLPLHAPPQRQRVGAPPRRAHGPRRAAPRGGHRAVRARSEEHTSELQSRQYLVCRLLLEKKKKKKNT